MEFAGWRPEEILQSYTGGFRRRVEGLILNALTSGRMVRQVAEALALERFLSAKRTAEAGSPRWQVMNVGIELYREGWVPRRLMRWMSEGYFKDRLR